MCKLKNSTKAAEMTIDMEVGARVNVEIIVRDYWNNPGKKSCGLNQSDGP